MFEDLFIQSKGKPVLYQGRLIYLSFVWNNAVLGSVYKLRFESTQSDWYQGVVIRSLRGSVQLIGSDINAKSIVLWSHKSMTERFFTIMDDDEFRVNNVWDLGNGTVHSFHNGGALKVEEVQEGYRFYANDGFPDDDFNDLIFTITLAGVL